MKSLPVISIIVPVYNTEKYLCRCLDSILQQSFSDFELIIVDDGSKDNSGVLCDKYADLDNRIKVIHQINQGVSCARNVGIDASCGRWVTFVDSDDYLEEGFLDIDYDLDVDLIIQKEHVIGKNLDVTFPTGLYEGEGCKDFLSVYLVNELMRVPWGKFLRTEIIRQYCVQFNTNYKMGEDTLFMLDYYLYCNKVFVAAKSCYMYRVVSNITNRYKISYKECICYIHDMLTKYNRLDVDCKDFLSFSYTFYSGFVLINGNHRQKHLWFRQSDIIYLNKEIGPLLPFKVRLKYFFYKYF